MSNLRVVIHHYCFIQLKKTRIYIHLYKVIATFVYRTNNNLNKMKNALLLLALLVGFSARAEVTLPALFSDNMILQQKTQAPIWGSTSKPGAKIKITTSWDNKKRQVTSDKKSGKWLAKLSTPSYGTGYTITIDDSVGDAKVINNVLIGEVWIASGQSNMEMQMSGFNSQPVAGGNRDIALSKDKNLRIMTVNRNVAAERTDFVKSSGWHEACSEVVYGTSATAYYFARTLREALDDVPIGILVSSWGGTTINSWTTPELANSYEDVKSREKKSSPRSQHYPGGLFNGMINPIAGYAARGFLWYQGEADRMRSETYAQKMSDMVSAWRALWSNGENMPFYYVQIAPYEYAKTKAERANPLGAYIREAQLKALDMIPKSAMAVISDAGLQKCIHPSNKTVVGERLAYLALLRNYGQKNIVAYSPTYKSHETKENTLIVSFDNAKGGLTTFGAQLTGFEVAGDDGVYHAATSRIRGTTVILSSKEVAKPTKARYGFTNWFDGRLYNLGGIPASSFRCGE